MPDHVELLSQALGDVLVAAGVVADQPMTGPELLAAASDYTEHLRAENAGQEPHHPACVEYGDDSQCNPCNR